MEWIPVNPDLLKKAVKSLVAGGWQVSREEGKWVDGSPCPIYKVAFPGYHQMVKGGIPIPFRKLYDFQVLEFVKELEEKKKEAAGAPPAAS